jgi:hypothetical protein
MGVNTYFPFFYLDVKETKDQGTGCHLGFTISAPPKPLFCRRSFSFLQNNDAQFGLETGTSKCQNAIFIGAPFDPPPPSYGGQAQGPHP